MSVTPGDAMVTVVMTAVAMTTCPRIGLLNISNACEAVLQGSREIFSFYFILDSTWHD